MNNKHDISEEEILSSAKNIMDNFMRSLEQATEVKEEFGQQRPLNKRPHHETNARDTDFIKRMFDNAPKKRDGYIIAEKKKEE